MQVIDDSVCTNCICHITYRKHPNITDHERRWDTVLRSGRSMDEPDNWLAVPPQQPNTENQRICKFYVLTNDESESS